MRNEERKGFSEKELLKYHEAVNVCVGNLVNKIEF